MQKENVNIRNKVILNLIQDLQRLSWLLCNNRRGRFQIKFGMTPLWTNRGFTLIEILVVVLIIGILAAIALPQYQVAVGKARALKLIPIMVAVNNAQQLYYLEHGSYATEFNQLTIDLNGTISPITGDIVFPDRSYCVGMKTGLLSFRCYIGGKRFLRLETYYSTQDWMQRYLGYKKMECVVYQTDKLGQKICQSLQKSPTEGIPSGGTYIYILDSWK